MEKKVTLMDYTQKKYEIVGTENIADSIYSFKIKVGNDVELAKPGQFVHIAIPGHTLRRPISICQINKEKQTIRIVFAAKGNGTRELSDCGVGSKVDVLGPLGNGFKLVPKDSNVILVGGGIGVPPMVGLSDYYGENAIAISGFRDKSIIILQDEFKKNGTETILCTDNGSAGIHGFVTQPLEEILKSGKKIDMVYSCGPIPMLKNIAGVCEKYNTPCQVSLEQRMGCGIGACLCCETKIYDNGQIEYKQVCKDGPVFDSKEVAW